MPNPRLIQPHDGDILITGHVRIEVTSPQAATPNPDGSVWVDDMEVTVEIAGNLPVRDLLAVAADATDAALRAIPEDGATDVSTR